MRERGAGNLASDELTLNNAKSVFLGSTGIPSPSRKFRAMIPLRVARQHVSRERSPHATLFSRYFLRHPALFLGAAASTLGLVCPA